MRASSGGRWLGSDVLKVFPINATLGVTTIGESLVRKHGVKTLGFSEFLPYLALSLVLPILTLADINVLAAKELETPRAFLVLLADFSSVILDAEDIASMVVAGDMVNSSRRGLFTLKIIRILFIIIFSSSS